MHPDEPTRRDRRRLQMLNHLATVAMQLFDRDGFNQVTMEQIAAGADVAKGTLYNHFPIKEAVLAYAIHIELGEDLEPLMKRLKPDAGFQSAVAPVMDSLAQWCVAHREYLEPYLRFRFMDMHAGTPDTGASRPSDIVDMYSFLIENRQRAGEIRKDFKPRHLAVLFHHLCLGALLRWLPAKNLNLRHELGAAVELFFHGVIPRAAAAQKRGRKA